jgi:hypothetical protein
MRTADISFIGALAAVLSGASAATATPNFPAIVQQVTGSPSLPSCTICHTDSNGGRGTAIKPFAVYLRSRGLVEFDETSLRNALAAAQAEMQGMAYLAALKKGLDPNASAPNGSAPQIAPPDYGCGAQVASRSGPAGAAPLLLTSVVLGIVRRRKKRRPEQFAVRLNESSPAEAPQAESEIQLS